jgi:hypothetical protein
VCLCETHQSITVVEQDTWSALGAKLHLLFHLGMTEDKDTESCKTFLTTILTHAEDYEQCGLKVDKVALKITWDLRREFRLPVLQREQSTLLDSILWWNVEYEELGYEFDKKMQSVTFHTRKIQIVTRKNVISFVISPKDMCFKDASLDGVEQQSSSRPERQL